MYRNVFALIIALFGGIASAAAIPVKSQYRSKISRLEFGDWDDAIHPR
jgi:hypothetical protein